MSKQKEEIEEERIEEAVPEKAAPNKYKEALAEVLKRLEAQSLFTGEIQYIKNYITGILKDD